MRNELAEINSIGAEQTAPAFSHPLAKPRAYLTQMYTGRQELAKNLPYCNACLTAVMAEGNAKERHMISKVLSGAVLAGLLLSVSAPIVAYAEDATPKTKADCKKAKDMKWDKATKTCVKK
jgi:hypothetical protein